VDVDADIAARRITGLIQKAVQVTESSSHVEQCDRRERLREQRAQYAKAFLLGVDRVEVQSFGGGAVGVQALGIEGVGVDSRHG
jgi:hypothetical protein